MINKNQVIVFVVSFLIVGFFVLCTPKASFSGTIPGGPPCCFDPTGPGCVGGEEAQNFCDQNVSFEFFPNRICVESEIDPDFGMCEPPQIPTLNQWGKIITIAVIGLFAVIGLIIMRRRAVES